MILASKSVLFFEVRLIFKIVPLDVTSNLSFRVGKKKKKVNKKGNIPGLFEKTLTISFVCKYNADFKPSNV